MGTEHDDTNDVTPPQALIAERFEFPRLELPPVPSFGRTGDEPAPSADDVEPVQDEPAGTWQPPFQPAFDDGEAQYRAMVERVNAMAVAAPAPVAAVATPAPIAEPEPVADVPVRTRVPATLTEPATVPAVPELAPAPELAPHKVSVPAVAIMVVLAAGLVWASRMAFSPALLAFAGLLFAQLAAAATRSPRSGNLPLLAGIPALGLAVSAAKGALGGFSEMAMVAGLFVIAAGIPSLLLLGVVQLILHRRAARASAAETALREGWKLRIGVMLAIVAAGVYVRDSFVAKPDAILTFAIVGLVLVTLAPLVRGGDSKPAA